ncbi:MAG: STAS domain-containing protein [Actinomycetota bacterium]
MATLEVGPDGGADVTRPRSGPGALALVVTGPITRGDVEPLCEGTRAAFDASDARLVVLDVAAIGEADVVTIESLARLELTVRRAGGWIRFRRAGRELHELVSMIGLADILRFDTGSGVEARGETEEREEGLGVEEERDP